jgi:L-alanine-DL-glutamate epimerase-like enolase superfamily enzyme
MSIAAVDAALWDLKSRLLDLPLVTLLGDVRDRVPVYGSGGFTSYSVAQLQKQLGGWVEMGIPRVKMKVGRSPVADVDRVRAARQAIGDDVDWTNSCRRTAFMWRGLWWAARPPV